MLATRIRGGRDKCGKVCLANWFRYEKGKTKETSRGRRFWERPWVYPAAGALGAALLLALVCAWRRRVRQGREKARGLPGKRGLAKAQPALVCALCAVGTLMW